MNTKTPSNMLLPQHNIRTFVITLFTLMVVVFSGSAYSETKKDSKKPVAVAVKEMPALTENYKTELLVRFYDSIKSNTKDTKDIGALSDKSKDLFYNCMATRLTDTLWNSAAFKETRSFEAVNSQEVIKSNFEYCQLLSLTNDALKESTPQSTKVTSMSFNDLYVDYNKLVGQKVQVKGNFYVYGDIGSLSDNSSSATTLYVDISQLSRESRKLLLDQCSSGCNVELEGIVGDVQFLKGVSATKLYTVETKRGLYTIEAK
jgi:hypothetical protein